MRKKLIAAITAATMALSLTACVNRVIESADTVSESIAMFERHRFNSHYSILVDKETGVCYLEKGNEDTTAYGITVMLNPDGTPKIWRGKIK